jgi:prepilin-type N-terminal cleavage/methylation domain-containing protein
MKKQQGFTIIELLIATLVFSIVMVVCLSAFLRTGQLYYKAIYLARTQEAARDISDDIVNELRHNGGATPLLPDSIAGHQVYFLCVGNQRYSFMSGHEVDVGSESGTNFGLVRDDMPSSGCVSPSTAGFSANHTELLNDKMRLVATGTGAGQSDLLITPIAVASGSTYDIHIHIDFGDDDLLDNPALPGTTCVGPLGGSQFCATTDIDTTVLPL